MSSLSPEHSSGPRSLTQLFDNALREYTIRMGIDLARQGPLARELHGSTSVDSVIRVYEKQFRFGNVRASVGKAKMTTALRTTVGATSMLSARGEDYALGCVLSPANAVLGSIGVLLEAAEKSSTNYDVTLVNLFESVNKSLERLVVHTDNTHSITVPRIKSILVEIAIQILRICALATHKIREGRLTLGSLEASLRAGQIYHAMGSLDEMINEELSVVDTLPTGTMAVRNLEAESNERQRVEIYAKCQDWLLPPDPSVNHIDTRSRHSEGTSLWLLRSYAFENWKESGSLLWISGEPGTGKTFLCSAVIEHLTTVPPTLPFTRQAYTAYFYCSFGDAKKQTAHGLLCALLAQLSAQSDSHFSVLSQFYSERRLNSSWELSLQDLAECLEKMLRRSDGVMTYIVVDALDECLGVSLTSERAAILELLRNLADLRLPHLRICATSRHEGDTRAVLIPQVSHHVELWKEHEQGKDIIRYVYSRMESHKKMRMWPEKIQESVVNALSAHGNGVFRYAACQLDMLCERPVAGIEDALENLPKTLQETYEAMLQHTDEEKWSATCRLLQCLLFSARPLLVAELADVLAIDFSARIAEYKPDWCQENPEQTILSVCPSSFITIVGDQTRVVQLAHRSVKEFLVARSEFTAELSHITLARACLSILCLISSPRYNQGSILPIPLSEYAAEYWLAHAQFGNVSLSIKEHLARTFRVSGPYLSALAGRYHGLHNPGSQPKYHSQEQPVRPPSSSLYYASLWGFHHLVGFLLESNPQHVNMIGGNYGTPLHAAASCGSLDTLKVLLEHGADVNARGGEYGTSLQAAAYHGSLDNVQLLLNYGAHVNAQDGKYGTPLQAAAYRGSLGIVQLLLQRGANVNTRGGEYGTPLQAAAYCGSLDIVQLLLQRGANVNAESGKYGTPLQAAAYRGSLDIVRLLLKHDTYVNGQGGKYGTPLQITVHRGSLDILQLLLKHGADANERGGGDAAPLKLAVSSGSSDAVRLLLKHGAEVNAHDGDFWTALQVALHDNVSPEIVELLLDHGADVDANGGEHATPLQVAASRGSLDAVRLLLTRGADVNIQGGEYWTPLQAAACRGSLSISRLLLNHGANINAQGGQYETALQAASVRRLVDNVRLLRNHSVSAGGRGGYESALRAAASHNGHSAVLRAPLQAVLDDGKPNVAQLLLANGANIITQSRKHGTALHMASADGEVEAVEFLLRLGVDVNMQDGKYRTALRIASACGHLDVVELLYNRCRSYRRIRDAEYGTAFKAALVNEHFDVAEFFLQRGVDINGNYGEQGTPALHDASTRGHLRVMDFLLDHDADANTRARDEYMSNSLQVASAYGRLNVVELLLRRNADPNAEASPVYGTALSAASICGNIDVVHLLLRKDVDVNAEGGMYGNALQAASAHKHPEIVQLLLKHGAEVNSEGGEYGTALQAAAARGHSSIVELLLEHGADASVQGGQYGTAMQAAAFNDHDEVVDILSDAMQTQRAVESPN